MALSGEQPLFDAELQLAQPVHRLHALGTEGLYNFRYLNEEGLIVRDIWQSDLAEESMPKESLRLSRAHHTILQKLGICVVSYAQAVVPEGITTEAVILKDGKIGDFVVAHAVTPFVADSRPLLSEGEDKTRIDLKRIGYLIADPLSRYITWCQKTQQEYFLSDIYSLNQYSIHAPTGIIFLHDIDPLLLEPTEYLLACVEEDIKQLRLGLPLDFDM